MASVTVAESAALIAAINNAERIRGLAISFFPDFRVPAKAEEQFRRAERSLARCDSGGRWFREATAAYTGGTRRLKRALVRFFITKSRRRLERLASKLVLDIDLARAGFPNVHRGICEIGDLVELLSVQPVDIADLEDFALCYQRVRGSITVLAQQQRRRDMLYRALDRALLEKMNVQEQ